MHRTALLCASALALLAWQGRGLAAPTISRLTPPSELFSSNDDAPPYVARFAAGQRFDLQATVQPASGTRIASVRFAIDGTAIATVSAAGPNAANTSFITETAADPRCTGADRANVEGESGTPACVLTTNAGNEPGTAQPNFPAGTAVVSYRAYDSTRNGLEPGKHTLTVSATDDAGSTTTASGNFEIVAAAPGSAKAKNVIILLGDGMGASHRTAARIMLGRYAQGKARHALAMDRFPVTAMITTASLDSIVTDSAPGMQNYVTGNKAANAQEGVFPDDTTAHFDNPRVEYLAEFLARSAGKKLGIVTTADVSDATPASMAVHTQSRGAGTGIVDQFFDDRALTGLTVLMGGGRKWFLPAGTACNGTNPACGKAGGAAAFNGSARSNASDYVLPADIVAGWFAAPGALDPERDLIGAFRAAGWSYASDKSTLDAASTQAPLLGLFSLAGMNVALDRISGRRGRSLANPPAILSSSVVADYGFPDQPMLDEMTVKALQVLDHHADRGFVLLVEGGSIDKQAHAMDSERWILDTIELDRAVRLARDFVDGSGAFAGKPHPDTLVLVTADHECAGASIIGASTVSNADMLKRATAGPPLVDAAQVKQNVAGPRGWHQAGKRDRRVVGTYEAAHFPAYTIAEDGYPTSTDPDHKLLIGYGANADRFEDWLTNARPLRDARQPGSQAAPLAADPATPAQRDVAGNFFVAGQIGDIYAAHTGADVPLSAYGRGQHLFGGTMDNTDVFFALIQATVGGTALQPAARR